MRRNRVCLLSALTFLFGILFFLPADRAMANSDSVTISPNASNATVAVTITDADLSGKEISVVCYEPGKPGAVNDLTANKNYIVYINQYTGSGATSFSFPIRKQLVKGDYTLVITSEKEQIVKTFQMIADTAVPPTTNTPTINPASPGLGKTGIIKQPKAPAGVKAKAKGKKRIQVTWKKVSGAKGYIIGTATKKNGKYKTALTVKGGSKKKATLKKLKSGKVYYVKVKAYRLSGKKKIAGKWSKPVKVKVR